MPKGLRRLGWITVIIILLTGGITTACLNFEELVRLPNQLRASPRLSELPQAQQRRQVILAQIDSAAAATLLQDRLAPLVVDDQQYVGCIKGGVTRAYGTALSFAQVIAAFGQTFTASRGWRYLAAVNFYGSTTAEIRLIPLDAATVGEAQGIYPTYYQVVLSYAEPAITACYG